jgi:Concanavalin A-like lectin/glucanases superfamily
MTMNIKQVVALFVCLWTSATTSASLTDGLVSHYPFNGNANDVGANHNNGTLHGGVTLAADHNGNPNSAYHFNGTDGFITASSTNLPTGKRTVVISFKANSFNNLPALLGYGGSGVCGTSWLMGLKSIGDPTDIGRFAVSGHCGVHSLSQAYVQEKARNHWIHLAVSTKTEGTSIYVNGNKNASSKEFFANTPSAGKLLAIGMITYWNGLLYPNASCTVDPNIGCFSGEIEDVKIYNRALTDTEVKELYHQDFPPQIRGASPWARPHTVTCNNITQATSLEIPLSSAATWNCEKAGLQINSGDVVSVTIEGNKF